MRFFLFIIELRAMQVCYFIRPTRIKKINLVKAVGKVQVSLMDSTAYAVSARSLQLFIDHTYAHVDRVIPS